MFLNVNSLYVIDYVRMGKLSTPLLSNMLFFFRSFTACGRDSCCNHHLVADIYRIEIRIMCFIKQRTSLLISVKNGDRDLNIRDTSQPPSYLWSCCHNENEENIQPIKVDKTNSVVGVGSTGLKPISEYPRLSHVLLAGNISACYAGK